MRQVARTSMFITSMALLGTTAAAATVSLAEMRTYTVPLTGAAEVNFAHPRGGTGDLKGSGIVELRITPATRQVCYHFELSGLSQPLMARIHRGQPLSVGPPVVTLFTGPGGDLDSCVSSTHSQLADILRLLRERRNPRLSRRSAPRTALTD